MALGEFSLIGKAGLTVTGKETTFYGCCFHKTVILQRHEDRTDCVNSIKLLNRTWIKSQQLCLPMGKD